nr:hypothetical protein [Tanacetum cinerariifolium]
MVFPEETMSDTIKAFTDYLNYLAKSIGTQPRKGQGKGLITKKAIKVILQKKETIRIPKKKYTKTIVEETSQSKELVDTLSLEESEADEEEYMKKSSKESINEYILQQCPKGPGKGSSLVPDTSDNQSDSSGSSHFGSDDEEGFLKTANEELKDKSDDERTKTDKSDHDAWKKKDEKIHVLVPELEKKKPEVPPPSSSQTLSSAFNMVDVPIQEANLVVQETPFIDIVVAPSPAKTTHSPKTQSPKPPAPQSKTKIIIKKPNQSSKKVDAKVFLQRLMKLKKKVEAMSKIDHTKEIDKSVQAHLKKELPKDVPNFDKIKQEKASKKNMPKYSTKPFDEDSLMEYDQKNKLMSLMMKSKSFNTHPTPKKLYEALMESFLVGEDDMYKSYDTQQTLNKRHYDDQDPPAEDKTPFEPSKIKKVMDAEESIQYDAMDAAERTQDDEVTEPDRNFKNNIKLEYNVEQCYLALTDQIYWANPEGGRCPYDLRKPLPLQGLPCHKTIPVNFFFNKDLEYLKTGNKENKYVVSLTKLKATRYELEGLEEMILKLWSSSQKEYTFKEADFPRIHLNDIEDMYLLMIQNKHHHLTIDEQFDLYTIVYEPRGVVYQNKSNQKILMGVDELYKFNDGTLKLVYDNLDSIMHNFILGYNNQGMLNRVWSVKDQKRTSAMLKKIDKTCWKEESCGALKDLLVEDESRLTTDC